MRFTRRTLDLVHSPIGEAHALLSQRVNTRPLLDLSQAAPSHAAPPAVVERLTQAVAEPDVGRYAPQPGLPELRSAFAAELSHDYRGTVAPDNILITAGCNQAFCVAVSALTEPGDEVILPVPYYFNHDMWMKLDGVRPVYLESDNGVPSAELADALVGPRTRAIVLVTPGNPSGVTISPEVIGQFGQLAARHNIALIVDETYRNFRGTDEPAHALFAEQGWADHVISLHSFSKDLAIPGYRVGAAVAGPAALTEMLKILDCVAICAPRIGQEAALAGLLDPSDWRAQRQQEVLDLKDVFDAAMGQKPGGFHLRSSGAYFGWVQHPFPQSSADVTRRLVVDHDLLVIPGTAFTPDDRSLLRFSFANMATADVQTLTDRLVEAGA